MRLVSEQSCTRDETVMYHIVRDVELNMQATRLSHVVLLKRDRSRSLARVLQTVTATRPHPHPHPHPHSLKPVYQYLLTPMALPPSLRTSVTPAELELIASEQLVEIIPLVAMERTAFISVPY